ncbi:LLM class flavin-dependent oxidoreductase [Actinomycetospora sp. TBRC 11914]|uniref:LLM class flavin-dependent oxidoreductase n=1 Tax=Actinomycetospora sp. TBRC 11914 TaxID=2729387 RepID=UPI00145F0513|nr:LLM class flavin-dependent oxidoreductase [Actinomycetospora sp. TBRC 11914]NMO91505.1 LLM class flavin-dependent oxidoreductase [Actinomycetospora sp. TBRC 11914]
MRRLHLNAFLLGVGHHEAAWRTARADPAAVLDVEHYRHLARVAERGTFDSVFLADKLSTGHAARHNVLTMLEPTVLLAALASATSRIGLIATLSTGFDEPYHVARRLLTLDHVSGGRAGWNVVTSYSDAEARNFGADRVDEHDRRYRRAAEFVDVVRALWDSWEVGAFVHDRHDGVFADVERVHDLHHRGEFFRVDGALTAPRSRQGHPLLVQAGASPTGRDFAAGRADAVFTAHQTLADARAFRTDLRARAARAGRDPDDVVVLPGIVPIVGATEAAARARAAELDELVVTDYALRQLENLVGRDLSGLPLDGPLPDLPAPGEHRGAQGRLELITRLARDEGLTIRGILGRLAGGRGHLVVVGTPEHVADVMAGWFTAGGADGFNVMAAELPAGLEDFVEGVVPELRRRGLHRDHYDADTLRGHYGLASHSRGGASR